MFENLSNPHLKAENVNLVFKKKIQVKTMQLKTKRLTLRQIKLSDQQGLFAYRSDKQTNKYQGWIPETLEEVASFLSKISKTYNNPDSWFQFAIIENSSGHLIGDLGIRFLEEGSRQAELGCTLNKNFHGKGYANEALTAVMNSLFLDLDFHRIFASIDPNNKASIKMMEKLGFRKEAHFKESLLLNGQWVDDVVFAILKKEWLSTNTNHG